MKQGIKIENGYIYLSLSERELTSVLEDMMDCGDLVSPKIVIEGNYVRFRDEDVKMMEPELFFSKEEPRLKLSSVNKKHFFLINFLGVSLFLILFYLIAGTLAIGHYWSVLIGVLLLTNTCFYLYLESEHRERHRKAIYLKAKLLTYFYMVVNLDMTNSNERLSRTSERWEKDYYKVKQWHQTLIESQPEPVRARYEGVRYPDGEPVATIRDKVPNKLS